MAPVRSTVAIAIGVEWKKRAKRISASLLPSVPASPGARLSTSVREGPARPSLPKATWWCRRTGRGAPLRRLRSTSSTSTRTSPAWPRMAWTSAAAAGVAMSSRCRPPEPKRARSKSSQPERVALR
jgi:hypothetical protein